MSGRKPHVTGLEDMSGDIATIYTDVDGTLLGPGGGIFPVDGDELSPILADSLCSLLSKGISIVPISGRRSGQLFELCRLLSFRDYIDEMGSEIVYDLGERRSVLEGPEEGTYEGIERCGAVQALFQAFPGRLEYHHPWHEERRFTHLLRGCVNVDEADALLASADMAHLNLVDNGPVRRRSAALRCEDPHAYHLMLAGVSKEKAVLQHRKERGLEASACLAVGNSPADSLGPDVVGRSFIIPAGTAVGEFWASLDEALR